MFRVKINHVYVYHAKRRYALNSRNLNKILDSYLWLEIPAHVANIEYVKSIILRKHPVDFV